MQAVIVAPIAAVASVFSNFKGRTLDVRDQIERAIQLRGRLAECPEDTDARAALTASIRLIVKPSPSDRCWGTRYGASGGGESSARFMI